MVTDILRAIALIKQPILEPVQWPWAVTSRSSVYWWRNELIVSTHRGDTLLLALASNRITTEMHDKTNRIIDSSLNQRRWLINTAANSSWLETLQHPRTATSFSNVKHCLTLNNVCNKRVKKTVSKITPRISHRQGSQCGNTISTAKFCIVFHTNSGSILHSFRDVTTGRTMDISRPTGWTRWTNRLDRINQQVGPDWPTGWTGLTYRLDRMDQQAGPDGPTGWTRLTNRLDRMDQQAGPDRPTGWTGWTNRLDQTDQQAGPDGPTGWTRLTNRLDQTDQQAGPDWPKSSHIGPLTQARIHINLKNQQATDTVTKLSESTTANWYCDRVVREYHCRRWKMTDKKCELPPKSPKNIIYLRNRTKTATISAFVNSTENDSK